MSKKRINKKTKRLAIKKAKNRKSKASDFLWKNKNFKLLGLGLMIVTFIAFIPSINNEFVNWDDPTYVENNVFIHDINAENIKVIFSEPIAVNYHPLTFLSLAVDYAIGDGSPKIFHITNLVIHLINTFLVFVLVFLLFKQNLIIAFVSALLFGIHPMHVESVAWITERKDVLYTCFYLLGLLAYLKYVKIPKMKYFGLVLILFICSLLSKPAAVTFPLVLLLIDYWYNRGFGRKILLEKIPFFIFAIIITAITIQIQSDTAVKDLEEISFFQRLLFGPYGFIIYIVKFIFPFNFSTFYPYPDANNLPSYFYMMPILSLGFLGGIYFLFKKYKEVIFGILFFVLTISITLQIFSFGGAILAERYTYLPYIGLSICVGWMISHWTERKTGGNNLVYGLFSVYAIFLAGSTWQQCKVWKNSETLWSQVIDNASFVTDIGYSNRGKYYKTVGQFDKAVANYNIALGIRPDNPSTKLAMGNLLMEKNELIQALDYFNPILNREPNDHAALNSRGTLYARMQDYPNALVDLNKAIDLNPNYIDALKNRALTHLQMGQFDKSIDDFTRCLKFSPQDVDLLNAIGVGHQNMNRHQQAIDFITRCIRIDPNNGNWYNNRGISYNAIGQREQAIADWQKAVSLGYPVNPTFLNQ